jgi:flagellar motor switch protein FliG
MIGIILDKKEEFEQFLSEYPELRREFEQLNKQDQDIVCTIYDFLKKTFGQQSEHEIYREIKFNIFIRKYPRLKGFIENVRNLEKLYDFRYNLIRELYCH